MNVIRLAMGIFAIVVAIVFYIDALGYPEKAASMPLIYSVIVGFLGLAMAAEEISALVSVRRKAASGASNMEDGITAQKNDSLMSNTAWKSLSIFLLTAIYIYSISILGYLISTVAFMMISLTIVRHVTWRFAFLGIALLIAVVCSLFIGFLGLPVPLLPPEISQF